MKLFQFPKRLPKERYYENHKIENCPAVFFKGKLQRRIKDAFKFIERLFLRYKRQPSSNFSSTRHKRHKISRELRRRIHNHHKNKKDNEDDSSTNSSGTSKTSSTKQTKRTEQTKGTDGTEHTKHTERKKKEKTELLIMDDEDNESQSSFGGSDEGGDYAPALTKPSGMSPQATQLIPIKQFGKYMDNNCRQGNNLPNQENWLYKSEYALVKPFHGKTEIPQSRSNRSSRSGFGKYEYESNRLLYGNNDKKYYDKRGSTGFEEVPHGIYDFQGGNVPSKSFTPYDGARVGGALPRPYGPRDNAYMKGYPASTYKQFSKSLQKSNNKLSDHFNDVSTMYGPFIQSSYNNRFGKPVRQSMANSLLYSKEFNPYVKPTNQQAFNQQNTIKEAVKILGQENEESRSVSSSSSLSLSNNNNSSSSSSSSRFGSTTDYPSLYHTMGPNKVAYEAPYLTYNNSAGGNTYNFLTKQNYLPPYHSSKKPQLKVQPNNNPRGFLSNKSVLPVSGLGFGQNKSESDNKWRSYGVAKGRPYTTQLMSVGNGTIGSSTGVGLVGQPLDLYTYQNTNKGKYMSEYPQFLGPRSWWGGFGTRFDEHYDKLEKKTKNKMSGGARRNSRNSRNNRNNNYGKTTRSKSKLKSKSKPKLKLKSKSKSKPKSKSKSKSQLRKSKSRSRSRSKSKQKRKYSRRVSMNKKKSQFGKVKKGNYIYVSKHGEVKIK